MEHLETLVLLLAVAMHGTSGDIGTIMNSYAREIKEIIQSTFPCLIANH